jgi:hypothetical protein
MTQAESVLLIALAIIAHGWAGRMQGPPAVLSAIGWAINILALLALVVVDLRHGAP